MTNPKRTEEQTEWSNQFAHRFRSLLIEKKMFGSKFYKASGYSNREYNRIMGGSNPSLYKICKIAKALDVPIHELMDFSQEKKDRFISTGITNATVKKNGPILNDKKKRKRGMPSFLKKR